MKVLYIECNMGAAGDMLMSALLENSKDKQKFIEKINNIGLENVIITPEKSIKCGITGTHISVKILEQEELSHDHSHEHHHHDEHEHSHHHDEHTHDQHHNNHSHEHHQHLGMEEITHLINSLAVSDKVKKDAQVIYKIIADAESEVHGKPVSEVHFHEVGMMDAVADIVGVCMLMEEINADKIITSPVHVGSGFVKCAHGVLPVPAPATALILKGVPIYGGIIKGELCTPTGAAILKYFTDEFGAMPVIETESIGYGMGKKDFENANCVRIYVGNIKEKNKYAPNGEVAELSCNIDDMTAEDIAFAVETLLEKGALDVFTVSAQMKKGRAGTILTCLCKSGEEDLFAGLILKYTSTFGVRTKLCERYMLDRKIEEVETRYGKMRLKKGLGYGIEKSKFEYNDIAAIAKANGVSTESIRKNLSE